MQLLPVYEILSNPGARAYLMDGGLPDDISQYNDAYLLDNCLKAAVLATSRSNVRAMTKLYSDTSNTKYSVINSIATPAQYADSVSGRIYPTIKVVADSYVYWPDVFNISAISRSPAIYDASTYSGIISALTAYSKGAYIDYDFGEEIDLSRIEVAPSSMYAFTSISNVGAANRAKIYAIKPDGTMLNLTTVYTTDSASSGPYVLYRNSISGYSKIRLYLGAVSSTYYAPSLIFYGKYTSGKTSLRTFGDSRHVVVATGSGNRFYGLSVTNDLAKSMSNDMFISDLSLNTNTFVFPSFLLANTSIKG